PDLTTQALACIDESAMLLRQFIEDLLDVARIREQKLRVDMAEVDLAAIVRSALDLTAAGEHRHEIRFQLAIESAPLRGDRVRLLQVVWNLLSNAAKFSPPGSPIDVRLERDGNDVRLSVIDRGVGITAAFLPHVFELYSQADPNEDAPRAGLGIGLSIVEQIVKLHGGTVRVESPGLNHGSTFIVTLPLSAAVPGDAAPPIRSGRRSGISRRVTPETPAPRKRRRSAKSPSKPRTA
ncbi:MAG TPA: HAMP domain-containing sensor histidine kinase, partial [Thermoanaerobaculia bacterium]